MGSIDQKQIVVGAPGGGDRLDAQLATRCEGVLVDNFTAQYVYLPDVPAYCPPNSSRSLPLVPGTRGRAAFEAPPKVVQPAGVPGQTCYLTFTEDRVPWGTATTGGAVALPSILTLERFLRAAIPAAGTPGRAIQLIDYDEGLYLDNGTVFYSIGGEVINVKAYGALGDGIADDTAAIVAALGAVGALGNVVYFPPGTYRTTAQISIGSQIIVRGCGIASTIAGPIGAHTFLVVGNDAVVEQLAFSGASGGGFANVHITGSANRVDRCYMSGPNQGVFIDGGNDNVVVGCTIDTPTSLGVQVGAGGLRNRIVGNRIRIPTTYGILVQTGSNETVIEANVVQGGVAINGGGIFLSGSTSCVVVGNHVQGTTWDGIHLDPGSNNCTVSGNTTLGTTRHGIYVSTSSRVTVTGNTTVTATGPNLGQPPTGQLLDTCTDSVISGGTAVSCTVGLYIFAGSHASIVGSHAVSCTTGIICEAVPFGRVQDSTAESNTNHGIQITAASTNAVVSGCISQLNTGGATAHGILVDASTDVQVIGCSCTDNQNDGIAVTGASSVRLEANTCKNISGATQDNGISIAAAVTAALLVDNTAIGGAGFADVLNLAGAATDIIKQINPRARITHSVVQALADAVFTTLTFDTERWDTDNIHDAVNPTRLTARTRGEYHIVADVGIAAGAGTLRTLRFLVNGATEIARCNLAPNALTDEVMNLCTQWVLEAGDYVEVQMFQNSGGPLNAQKVNAAYPEFMMAKDN